MNLIIEQLSSTDNTDKLITHKGETAAGVIFDITNQKTIDKQKGEFMGIASHELKTPVTSIKAYAEILQDVFFPFR